MFSLLGFHAVCKHCLFVFSFITLGEISMHAFFISCCVSYLGLCVFGVFVSSCVFCVHVYEHCVLCVYTFVFVSSCVFCVHVCEHCVLCVYTFRPLSIPRRSPSDVSPNKLQNVKSRLNFHSIFQLASHQRGLSAQPTPNLLLTSIGFLMKIERHTYKKRIYIHRLNNRENGIFSGFAWIFPGLQDTRYLQWWMGTPLGKRGVARDGLREARQGLCCAVTSVLCCEVLYKFQWPVLLVGKKGWAGTTLRKAKWPSQ